MNTELTFANRDEFQRKSIAENINTLLASGLDLSPMMIDGNWGTGKTEFSHKLCNYLNENGKRYVVYIDAFKEDHTDEPILSIMAAIANILPEKEKKTLISKSLPAMRFGLKTLGKAGVNWFLKQDADQIADEFDEVIKDVSNTAIDKTVESLLNDHIDAEKNIHTLQTTLSDISKNKEIIIIIDELDRCKPSFSISILEKIKHIFNTENVHFILVANAEQIKASVNHIYGNAINAQRYLDKFIKYSFTLPRTVKVNDNSDKLASVQYWHALANENKHISSFCNPMAKLIEEMITRSNLSLRDVEDLVRHASIYQIISDNAINPRVLPILNIARLMALLIQSTCSRETIDNFPSKQSIETMAVKLGIKRLPFQKEYDIEDVPELEITFYLLIKDNFPSESFLSPAPLEIQTYLDQRIARLYSPGVLKTVDIRKTFFNAISIMTLSK